MSSLELMPTNLKGIGGETLIVSQKSPHAVFTIPDLTLICSGEALGATENQVWHISKAISYDSINIGGK
jgi:hypothetical protein